MAVAEERVVYKLTYFDALGWAEPIKYIFTYAGVPFEDYRFTSEEWPALQAKQPYGKVPVLEVNGRQLPQSVAICRYLGKKFGLVARDPIKEASLEAIVDTMRDVQVLIVESIESKSDEAKTAAEEAIASKYATLDTLCSDGFFYGPEPTWVDIYCAAMLDVLVSHMPNSINAFPNLRTLRYKIKSNKNVKKYLDTRSPYKMNDS